MNQVLDGITVVSLAINLPGPLAASKLSALGAKVIKVEPPTGDPLNFATPAWYKELTHGQEIRSLDLKSPDQRAEFDRLLAKADILLTASRPSALRRLGFMNPVDQFSNLNHIEIVGYDGAQENHPGHDLTFQAQHGTLQPPQLPLVPVADLLGAEHAVQAALAALFQQQRTGQPSHQRVVLDQAAHDAGAAARHGLTGTGSPLGGGFPGYGIYKSLDGFIAVAAIEPAFLQRTLDALGAGNSHSEFAAAFATKTTAEWEQIGKEMDIPFTKVTQLSSNR